MRVKALGVGVVGVLLAGGLTATAYAEEEPPDRVLVGLRDLADVPAVVADLDARPDVAVAGILPLGGMPAVVIEVPTFTEQKAAVAALGADPRVRYAEADTFGYTRAVPVNDPQFRPESYAVNMIPEAWTYGTGSAPVTVGLVDTGVSPGTDLDEQILLPGHDLVDGEATGAHGTWMAGVIAARADNGYGTAGVCRNCRVLPVEVMRFRGFAESRGWYSDIAAGIAWAAEHGTRVIDLPLSGLTDSGLLRDAVEYADRRGVLVVAAAGNKTSTERNYPAAYETVLAVGAVGVDGRREYGAHNAPGDRWVDVAAIHQLRVNHDDGTFTTASGTSVSASVVAAVAAQAFSLRPDATPAQVRAAIVEGARTSTGDEAPVLDAARTVQRFAAPDTVAPVVTSTGLTANEVLSTPGRTVRPVATDDHALDRVELVIGGTVVAADDRAPWELPLRPADLPGAGPVTVRATDYAGNTGQASTVVRPDDIAPRAEVVSPTGKGPYRGVVPVTVRSADGDVATVTLGDTVIDATATPGPWSANVATRHVVATRPANPGMVTRDGYLPVRLADRDGNETVLRIPVVVDERAPLSFVSAPAAGATVRGTFTTAITVTSDPSGIARAELWADDRYVGADTAAPYSLRVASGTRNGPVKLVWKVTDGVGNVFTATRTVTAKN